MAAFINCCTSQESFHEGGIGFSDPYRFVGFGLLSRHAVLGSSGRAIHVPGWSPKNPKSAPG